MYHDDFLISQGLLQPYTTLLSVAGLIGITVATFLVRKKSPLWLFAWGWFLISHALESTVFSLELVHEHRNYFATLGFLVLLPCLLLRATPKIRPFAFLVTGAFVALCGFITWQRATIWSDPLTHATFEAETHPMSDRANLELGFIYSKIFYQTKDIRYVGLAKQRLQKARVSYRADNSAWYFLILLAYQQNETPDPALVREFEQRLREHPITPATINVLNTFSLCQFMQECRMPHHEAIKLFAAALENPNITPKPRAELNQITGIFIAQTTPDLEKAETFLNEALRLHEEAEAHILLMPVLRLLGKFDLAREHLERARQLDSKNAHVFDIERELKRTAKAEQENQDKVSSPKVPSGSTLHP